jgi:toxic protein SymE
MSSEKNIRVHQTHYMYKLKGDHSGAGRPVPSIRLKGYWLRQAGFEIHTAVKIRIMKGCLVLTAE